MFQRTSNMRLPYIIALVVLSVSPLLLEACGNSLAYSTATATPTTASETFEYQVRILSQDTGKEIVNAKVTVEVSGIAPLDELTDSNGFTRFQIDTSRAGKPGRLIVEVNGYKRYIQNINLARDALPHVLLLESEVATASTSSASAAPLQASTQQLVSSPTSAPPPTNTAIPATPTPDTTLFSDDFENDLNPGWRPTIGDWGIVNGQLTVLRSSAAYADIEVGDASWDNYSIDFDAGDFERDSWGHFNTLTLYVRVKDSKNAAYFDFSWFGSRCGTRIGGTDTPIRDFGQTSHSPHFHIEIKGSNYEVFTDGESRCSYRDKTFTKGGVRFRVTHGDIGWPVIDNLVVKHIP